MNISERRAYDWFVKQGHQNISFQRNSSPDFVTASGDKFEVKKVRNNTIWFSSGQYQKLSAMKDVTIVVMGDADEPVAVFPFSEIKDGYWKNIKIADPHPDKSSKQIVAYVDEELWRGVKADAAKKGQTLQKYTEWALRNRLHGNIYFGKGGPQEQ